MNSAEKTSTPIDPNEIIPIGTNWSEAQNYIRNLFRRSGGDEVGLFDGVSPGPSTTMRALNERVTSTTQAFVQRIENEVWQKGRINWNK